METSRNQRKPHPDIIRPATLGKTPYGDHPPQWTIWTLKTTKTIHAAEHAGHETVSSSHIAITCGHCRQQEKPPKSLDTRFSIHWHCIHVMKNLRPPETYMTFTRSSSDRCRNRIAERIPPFQPGIIRKPLNCPRNSLRH